MFKTQKDGWSCGPVALYNVGVWLKRPRKYAKLYELCHTDEDGTPDFYFEETLRSQWSPYHLKITKKRKIDYDEIRDFLSKSNTAIVLDSPETWDDSSEDIHCSFWLSESLAINLRVGETYSKDINILDIIDAAISDGETPQLFFLEDLR